MLRYLTFEVNRISFLEMHLFKIRDDLDQLIPLQGVEWKGEVKELDQGFADICHVLSISNLEENAHWIPVNYGEVLL